MAQCHDLALVANGGYLQAVGQILIRDYPRVVATDGDVALNAAEDGVVNNDVTGSGNAMENVAEVLQLCTECLANSLMAKANAEVIERQKGYWVIQARI